MKPNILTKTIAALLLAVPVAHADEKKEEKKEERKIEEKKDGLKSGKTSSSSSVVSADGTATVTIDINGKKETRTFKLGDGNNTFSFGKDGDGAVASGAVGFGGKNHPMPEPAKREKGPWIGIATEPVQDVVRAQLSLAPGEGVVINHVAPESPAAKAGLQPNDILLRFEDQILVEPSQLRKLIAMKKPGENVKLGYLRKGERKDATVTLIEHEIEPGEGHHMQMFQAGPGGFNIPGGAFAIPGGKMDNRLESLQDQMKQLKEKHPGVIVDKRSWFSGEPGEMLKGQIDKLQRVLEDSKLPKEEIEKLRKELDHAKRQAEEAMERAKRSSAEAMEHARRAVDEASRAINNARKPQEKEKGENPKGENPKKPGEPL
jgi:membrane-associated protease RseP (regulator of RpoE activity)